MRLTTARRHEAMAPEVDLNFIASQCERLLAEVAAMRHDIAVLTALTRRLEDTQAAVLQATGVQARDGDPE
jgi:hypothetical protein